MVLKRQIGTSCPTPFAFFVIFDMGKCSCCGAMGKTKMGCSCNNGKSHVCQRLPSSATASASIPSAPPPVLMPEPHPEPMPVTVPTESLKIFVISIPGSPEGHKRMVTRGGLQPSEVMAKGFVPSELPENFKVHRYTVNNGVVSACLFSHYQVWRQIVVSNQSAIILEDDAMMKRTFDRSGLQQFPMVRLGGAVRGQKWASEFEDFVQPLVFMDIVKGFVSGINCYSNLRFTGSIAYFLRVDGARQLIDMVHKGKLRATDIMLNECFKSAALVYPPPYVECEGAVSQCKSPAKDQILVLLV